MAPSQLQRGFRSCSLGFFLRPCGGGRVGKGGRLGRGKDSTAMQGIAGAFRIIPIKVAFSRVTTAILSPA